MEIKINTLSENTANYGYLGEWGLSILVEVDGKRILMDTGLSFSAVHNAQLMGIDLTAIDSIVLSHGHADHTGGLREILRRRGNVDVISHPDVWAAKHVRRDGDQIAKYCGMPFSRDELEGRGAMFNLTKEPARITEHVLTTGEIQMASGYEDIEDNLYIKQNDKLLPDRLKDDLALIIDTEFGLVVVLGCAHRGMINTLNHARNLTNKDQIYAVIGGTHLIRASEERIEKTIADLKKTGVQKIGVSHCTGFHALARLSWSFEDKFFLNNAGTRFTLP